MLVDVTLKYSESIVRDAAVANWRRALGFRFVAALALVVGMLATVLALGIAFAFVGYLVPLRGSLRRLHQMQTREAQFQGESSGFRITSELGTIGLPWNAVKRVWRYPSFWLLVLSRSSQITIPLATVGPEAQSFILERIKSAGGKDGG